MAHGRSGPYRYYTCFSRNRYGRHGCQSDRLPADALERAVLESLQATYADTDLIASALKEARRRAEAALPGIRTELRSVDARIAKTEQALGRYYQAFESGALTSRRFATRTELLEQQLGELRREREEFQERLERESLAQPGADLLTNLRTAIADALQAGTASQRKAILQELVSEILVESRESILPTYRLPPAPVRVMSGMVDQARLLPRTTWPKSRRLLRGRAKFCETR